MSNLVKPELLGGFRDFKPEEMIARQQMVETIKMVYERFGAVPLETPALERSSVLGTDDEESKKKVYRFDADGQDVTLRFDLTVPLARFVAANSEIPKPFKRYQFGNVWRLEKAQAGRFREFAQMDIDVVGTSSMLADAEIIAIIYNTMIALGINDILIKFNNRKLLNALPQIAGFNKEKINIVLRIIDKLEKIGIDGVKSELSRQPDNEFDDSAANLSDESIKIIIDFILLEGKNERLLCELESVMSNSPVGLEGINELREICSYLCAYNISQEFWTIDLSVARGLDYYTGPVFETTLLALPEYGSVMSGGRFDGLVGRFTGQDMPAVGVSIGVDRLFAALSKLERLPSIKTKTQVLVVNWNDGFINKRLELVNFLRNNAINTELFFDGSVSIKGQMAYALKRSIPFVIFYGENEINEKIVMLKDLNLKIQSKLGFDACLQILKGEYLDREPMM